MRISRQYLHAMIEPTGKAETTMRCLRMLQKDAGILLSSLQPEGSAGSYWTNARQRSARKHIRWRFWC